MYRRPISKTKRGKNLINFKCWDRPITTGQKSKINLPNKKIKGFVICSFFFKTITWLYKTKDKKHKQSIKETDEDIKPNKNNVKDKDKQKTFKKEAGERKPNKNNVKIELKTNKK